MTRAPSPEAVDAWIEPFLLRDRGAVDAALSANAAAGLPGIDVSPLQGAFLGMLVAITGAGRVLEIGTLGGVSTIWMARALPEGGRIVTLEADARHVRVARANLEAAGVADRVEVAEGRAAETLPGLAGRGPFDLIFIDADKPSNPVYLDWALRLSRPGTVIVVDNVIREGKIAAEGPGDASVEGTRAVFERLSREAGVEATALQTVGAKGWDGFLLARVRR
jgi:predicted O-methyltransferase YrrM